MPEGRALAEGLGQGEAVRDTLAQALVLALALVLGVAVAAAALELTLALALAVLLVRQAVCVPRKV